MLAELAGVPVEELGSVCAKHWRQGDAERALFRLALYRLPPASPSNELRTERYRRKARHLVDSGLMPTMTRAIDQVARDEGVAFATVHDAVYRKPRKRRSH